MPYLIKLGEYTICVWTGHREMYLIYESNAQIKKSGSKMSLMLFPSHVLFYFQRTWIVLLDLTWLIFISGIGSALIVCHRRPTSKPKARWDQLRLFGPYLMCRLLTRAILRLLALAQALPISIELMKFIWGSIYTKLSRINICIAFSCS